LLENELLPLFLSYEENEADQCIKISVQRSAPLYIDCTIFTSSTHCSATAGLQEAQSRASIHLADQQDRKSFFRDQQQTDAEILKSLFDQTLLASKLNTSTLTKVDAAESMVKDIREEHEALKAQYEALDNGVSVINMGQHMKSLIGASECELIWRPTKTLWYNRMLLIWERY
jgi:hypothetical protein